MKLFEQKLCQVCQISSFVCRCENSYKIENGDLLITTNQKCYIVMNLYNEKNYLIRLFSNKEIILHDLFILSKYITKVYKHEN